MNRYSDDHALGVAAELENEVFGASTTEGEQIEEAAAVIRSVIRDREELKERVARINAAAVLMNGELNRFRTARPLKTWTADVGPAIWVTSPATTAWLGTPLDEGWPGVHTHYLPLPDMAYIYYEQEV